MTDSEQRSPLLDRSPVALARRGWLRRGVALLLAVGSLGGLTAVFWWGGGAPAAPPVRAAAAATPSATSDTPAQIFRLQESIPLAERPEPDDDSTDSASAAEETDEDIDAVPLAEIRRRLEKQRRHSPEVIEVLLAIHSSTRPIAYESRHLKSTPEWPALFRMRAEMLAITDDDPLRQRLLGHWDSLATRRWQMGIEDEAGDAYIQRHNPRWASLGLDQIPNLAKELAEADERACVVDMWLERYDSDHDGSFTRSELAPILAVLHAEDDLPEDDILQAYANMELRMRAYAQVLDGDADGFVNPGEMSHIHALSFIDSRPNAKPLTAGQLHNPRRINLPTPRHITQPEERRAFAETMLDYRDFIDTRTQRRRATARAQRQLAIH